MKSLLISISILIVLATAAVLADSPATANPPPMSVKEKAQATPLPGGYVRRPYLGFYSDPRPDGQFAVVAVSKGTGAARGGLQTGDILISIAGRPIKKRIDLIDATAEKPIGESVPVEVLRDGNKVELSLELGFSDMEEPLMVVRRLLYEEKKVNLAVMGGEILNTEVTDPVKLEQWAKATKSAMMAKWENRLLKCFPREKLFSIVDRDAISQVMKELNFGQSGVVSESFRAKLGKTLGATHLLMVELTRMGTTDTEKQRLIEIETGKVLVSCMHEIAPPTEKILFSTCNDDAVSNGGLAPTFTLSQQTKITQIMTYHWNRGQGAPAGTLAIRLEGGRLFGPWPATVVNKYQWQATPNVTLPPGRYQLLDSDPATWAQNPRSNNFGHARIKGI